MGFFVDEDYGDILDVQDGFDLKVTFSQQPGKQFQDTTVDCKGRSSKLHDDSKQSQMWIDSVPSLDDMYRLKSKEEIETILNNWLNGDMETQTSSDEGTARGNSEPDALDDLVKEVKSKSSDQSRPAPQKPSPKKPQVDDDEADVKPTTKKKSLDEAFEDLMGEEL